MYILQVLSRSDLFLFISFLKAFLVLTQPAKNIWVEKISGLFQPLWLFGYGEDRFMVGLVGLSSLFQP